MKRKTLKIFLMVLVLNLLAGTVYSVPFKDIQGGQEIEGHSVTAMVIPRARAYGLDSPSIVSASLTSGTNECLVILIEFNNETYQKSSTDFSNLLFSNAATSLRSYFKEISYNALTITGTVKGPFSADFGCFIYANGQGGLGSYPNNSQGLVEEILEKADSSIDFSEYDKDNDGYVDSLMFVFSGYYDPTGVDGTKMYPHKWSFPYETQDGGIRVLDYMMVPELTWEGSPDTSISEIGIWAHEFSHILGLPEMYDTSTDSEGYYNSRGLGNFCLMARGCYGADGQSPEKPVHPNVWCKTRLGWVTPTVITENCTKTIKNIEENAEAYKVIANKILKGESEYFLVVNRQKKGFDSDMFGEGILIYHVDEDVPNLEAGNPNDNKAHKYVDLEEADGNDDLDNNRGYGEAEDFFTDFDVFSSSSSVIPNSNTYPNEKNTRGRRIAFTVTDISSSIDDMIATFTVKKADVNPSAGKSNIFTPNHDGYNDNIVFTEATGLYTIKIFDMAGRVIKTLENNNTWDGMYGESKYGIVESGVYIYQIQQQDGSVVSGTVVVAK